MVYIKFQVKKVVDTTRKDTKISLWTRFRLLFVKKQFSEDLLNDNGRTELWSKTTYKVLDEKIYILDFITYYAMRHRHCKNFRSDGLDE